VFILHEYTILVIACLAAVVYYRGGSMSGTKEKKVYDCIVIGAGPGGLQAAIYLCRYNRSVLILDRGGGRTWHAKQIENFLTRTAISGREIVEKGLGQAMHFGAEYQKTAVSRIAKDEENLFELYTRDGRVFSSLFVIVATGVMDNLPAVENLYKFFGVSLFTCVDCDGFRTTNKKLVIIGDSEKAVRLALAMEQMYTRDITVLLYTGLSLPGYEEELKEQGISLLIGEPLRIIGHDEMEALELKDGRKIECEVIMSYLGYRLNDEFLSELTLKKDNKGFKYVVRAEYESSVTGLYIVGPLNTGNDQVVIAAGQGATAAIDINKRLLEIHAAD
jgi:thioredoxin reductase (NADPH)